jgi:phosphohistidine swiveling domain-containing protein
VARPVLPLTDVTAGDVAIAGGKGAHLGELAARGFPVPPGFVVTSEACRGFFEKLDLAPLIARLAEGGDPVARCAELRARIVGGTPDHALTAAILEAHASLLRGSGEGVLCAVRSSATAEDLGGASFAGQHGTYYYVDAARLLEMIRHCWASLFSPEAVSYRATHGIADAAVAMAVVVQEMVPAEVSGVAFTANPVTASREEIVVEASWGMGAAIVDGRVTPDRYVVARDGLAIREQRIADKRFMVLSRLEAGAAHRVVEVPHDRRRAQTLDAAEVRTVAEWSLKCEAHFGAPQDVEWALAGGRFHLLQSRPITTLGRDERVPEGRYLLFKPLAENFTDPLTPLTIDLLLLPMPLGYRAIRGRLYMNLDHLRPLIPLRISDEDLATVLYLGSPTGTRPPVSWLKVPGAVTVLALAHLAAAVALARMRGLPDDFMEGYRALCRRVEADPTMGPAEAMLRLLILPAPFDPIGNLPLVVNGASLRFGPWAAALAWMLRRWAPGVRPETASLLCAGSEGVLSAEMGRSLRALAAEALAAPRVVALLAEHGPARALALLRDEPSAAPFLARLDAFLAVHGHRAVKEFELRTARWDEDPAAVLALLRNCLVAGAGSGHAEDKSTRARAEAEDEVRRALERRPLERLGRPRWRLVDLAATRARQLLKLRENSRFFHIMGFGVVRKKVLAVEAELLRDGRLKCKDDAFFLLWSELEALRREQLRWADVEDRIRERRLEHVRFAKLPPPRTFGIATAPLPSAAVPGGGLRGQCASSGRYRGRARVILDPTQGTPLQQGEVLVAPYTDPAWTPLFLAAGAAVIEVGSYLSHAGTVAREFGMPCLVDVADATRLIPPGALVDVDADGGVVRVVEASALG